MAAFNFLCRGGSALGSAIPLYPKTHYYHPAFNGSYSIKAVLPTVAPHLAYDDLEIQEGTVASVRFYRMVFEKVDEPARARIRAALLAYCGRDTLAMVELRRALRLKAQG